MRPVRLEVSGFSAFRASTTIDFTDVEVFALVGATGAGKSSIIDALTFALYGSVARYGEKDVAPIIHQLSTEARVRFDFDVANQRYTVVRVVRRTKTGATTREARVERGNDVLAGDAKAVTTFVEGLLGLTFERFNKTVVLPQGRFAEFLHDKPSQRQELMRELLGLGMYERIGQLARLRSKDADTQADVLRRQLAHERDLSDAEHERLGRRTADIAAARTHVVALADEAVLVQAERAASATQLDAEVRSAALVASIAVPSGVARLGTDIAAARSDGAQATSTLSDAAEARRRADLAAQHGPSVSTCEALLTRYRLRANLLGRTSAADAELAAVSSEYRRAAETAAAATTRITEARSQAEQARDEHRRAIEAIDGHPDQPSLEALIGLFDQRSALLDERQLSKTTAAAAQSQTDAARDEHRQAREELERARQLAPAVALTLMLELGEPCPVCDQPVHVLPEPHGDSEHMLQQARTGFDRAEARLTTAQEALSKAEATAEAVEKSLARLDDRLAVAPPLDHIRRDLDVLQMLRAAEAQARLQQTQTERALQAVESSADTQQAIEHERLLDRRLVAVTTTAEHLRQELAAVEVDLGDVPDEQAVVTDLQLATTLAADRTAASAAHQEAEDRHRQAAARLERLQRDEATARTTFNTTRDQVASLRPPGVTDDLAADWGALETWRDERSVHLRQLIDALRAEHQRLVEADEALLAKVVAIAEPFVPAGSSRDIARVRERLAAAEAAALAELQRFEDDATKSAAIRTELMAYETAGQVAAMLGDLLRSTKFERWLLDEAITDLVQRATIRLQELTAGQYSLISYEGTFRICDHRNADEIRDARSLSGGETFLASLSLALALADSAMDLAAEGTAPLESIFLDEGFGTLDPDTLDTVAGTIEDLGAAGRMVGIVTHIRELAERMPVRFEVQKGPSTSTVSRIEQ